MSAETPTDKITVVPPRSDLVERLRRHVIELAVTGQTLRGEYALAEWFGTSRPAVREAIVALEREGLVRRHRGSGTTINPMAADLVHRFDRQVDFAETLTRAGYVAQVELLESGWIGLDPETAARLKVGEGTAAFRTVKRWTADGTVAMVATDVVAYPGDDRPPVDPHDSLFTLVARLTGDVVDWEIAWPSARNLDRRHARWFGLRAGHAVLALDLVGVGRQGVARYHATELHRPGIVNSALVRPVGV